MPLPIDQIVGNTSHVINTDDLQSPSVIGEHQIDRVGVDNVIENHDERNQDPNVSTKIRDDLPLISLFSFYRFLLHPTSPKSSMMLILIQHDN